MQTEQLNTQTKKTSIVKKDKKPKSKTTETEQLSQQTENVVSVEHVVQPSVVTQVQEPVVEVEKPLDDVVLLETDFSSMVESLNTFSDRFLEFTKSVKDSDFSKEERGKFETSLKRLQKSFSLLQTSYYDRLSRQVSSLEKNSGHKSGGVKKVQDKEKSAIHKKLAVHPFLLNFMKLEQGTLVSRSDALSAITGYVKNEKEKNPDIIVEADKRSFKLLGELKVLFDGIEQVMHSKNLLEGKQMPSEIKYTQIMEYMTHCFVKTDDTTVV